uniref:Uncharacterized protein n=1 Tax=Triticum urartu TaxID=4572 RepID=A0A8R7UEJ4_TRIUA
MAPMLSPSCRWRHFLFVPRRPLRPSLPSLPWRHCPNLYPTPSPPSQGSRSERDKVPSVLVVRNEAGSFCSLIFWRLGVWPVGAPISLRHPWQQQHLVKRT